MNVGEYQTPKWCRKWGFILWLVCVPGLMLPAYFLSGDNQEVEMMPSKPTQQKKIVDPDTETAETILC